MGHVFAKSNRFRLKLLSGKSNSQSSYPLLIKLNASYRKFDGNIILVPWKTDYTNPKKDVDGYLKQLGK